MLMELHHLGTLTNTELRSFSPTVVVINSGLPTRHRRKNITALVRAVQEPRELTTPRMAVMFALNSQQTVLRGRSTSPMETQSITTTRPVSNGPRTATV